MHTCAPTSRGATRQIPHDAGRFGATPTGRARRLLADQTRLDGVAAMGVDETAFLAANAQHPTLLVTGIVDVHAGRLLDVVEGRSAKALCA